LDFAKAFDTIDWSFILKIFLVRDFGVRWCGWILSLLSTDLSSVLINGQPGTPSDVSED